MTSQHGNSVQKALPWVRSGADTRVPPHLMLRMYGLPERWALVCRPLMTSMPSSMSETCLKGYRAMCSIDMIGLIAVVIGYGCYMDVLHDDVWGSHVTIITWVYDNQCVNQVRWIRFGYAYAGHGSEGAIRNTNHKPCLTLIPDHPAFFRLVLLPPSFQSHHPTSHTNTLIAPANLFHVGSARRVNYCTDERREPFTSIRRVTCARIAFAGSGRPQVPHLPAALCQIGTSPSPYPPPHKGTSVCLCCMRQVVRAQVSTHMYCAAVQ